MTISPNDVTIIIPHLGFDDQQEWSLDECVHSLKKTVPDIEILVANNGNECGLHYGDVVVKYQGQCKAVNAAAATVDTPWIFVTNDDMIYAPGWFERLTNYPEHGVISVSGNPKDFNGIDCVSPNLVEPQNGAPPFIKKFCGGAGGDFDVKCWLEFAKDHKETGVEEGFNLPFLIRKDLWEMIGGYDVAYDPWGSNGDSDLQAKIHLAGSKTYRNRNAIVYHFSQTSGTFHPDQRSYWEKNYAYFQEKWGFERQPTDKVWYSQELINYDKLIYHPLWEGKWKN